VSGGTYYLVGCGSDKADGPRPAGQLYTSKYFERKWAIAGIEGDKRWVLSAEHHVLPPDKEISPYDTSMDELDEEETAAWAEEVTDQLALAEWTDDPEATLVVLAGQDYVEPLREWLEDAPFEVRLPFSDTSGQGEQNRLLKHWLRELENSSLADYC